MKHTGILNYLATKKEYKSYLEIGCANDSNFSNIIIEEKTGIDPISGGTLKVTSDTFFKTIEGSDKKFDLIFIDGDHSDVQVEKDILNSLDHLSEDGMIMVHDLLPKDELMQKVPREVKIWTGNGWKAWVRLRKVFSQGMVVIDTDFGCGLIHKGKNIKLKNVPQKLEFKDFVENKQKWMNIITVEDFLKTY